MKFTPPSPPSYIPSSVQLSTRERLGYVWFLHFLSCLFVYTLQSKKIFRINQHLTVLKKHPIFFILTPFTNTKIHKTKFEAGCSYKDCNQFLT